MTATIAPGNAPAARTVPEPAVRRAGILRWSGYGVLLVVVLGFSVGAPAFLTSGNVSTILAQASVYAIAGTGFTFVVATGGDDVLRGGIDLSVGATAGLAGTVVAVLAAAGTGTLAALAAGLGAALAVGAVNGAVVVAGLRPLLATLATMGVASSLDLVISSNVKTPLDGALYDYLREGSVAGVPASVALLIVVALVATWALHKTSWGVNSFATGDSATAARVAGLPVARYTWTSYVLCSGLAGVAGILLASRLSASVPGIGTQILLDIILVSTMSAVFSSRLLVSVPGTVLSAVFVAALSNGLTLLGVASQWVGAAKGVLILVVLAAVALRGRKSS